MTWRRLEYPIILTLGRLVLTTVHFLWWLCIKLICLMPEGFNRASIHYELTMDPRLKLAGMTGLWSNQVSLFHGHPEAIKGVENDMDQKSDADYSCPGYGRKQDIQPYDRIGMKRVKVYAATMGIKKRIGHQMVQIDHHSESPFPWNYRINWRA